jgi:membrane dipeptidase
MIIDVSHISDEAFYQVIEHSRAPVVATHSCCRHFTPGWERNMDDAMIRRLAEKGGLIHIHFGSMFASAEVYRKRNANQKHVAEHIEAHQLEGEARSAFVRQYYAEQPAGQGDVSDVADQIDHVVKLVGVDHVGLGSDFDGVGTLPKGLTDVSCYPNLIYELLKRGYTEGAVEKICSGNFLRVWSTIRAAANPR